MKYKCYLCQHEWDYEYLSQYRYIECPNCGKTIIEVEARKTKDVYDYREVQKKLGLYDCGNCPRCNSKLHRCPFCGEKFCIECGWDEQAISIASDKGGIEKQ